MFSRPLYFFHREVKLQFSAVVHGVAHGRDSQVVRADDGTGGGVEGAYSLIGDMGLQFPEPFFPDYFETLYAVFHASFIEGLNDVHIPFVKADDKGTVSPIGNAQILGHLLHHLGTTDV